MRFPLGAKVTIGVFDGELIIDPNVSDGFGGGFIFRVKPPRQER